MKHKLNPEQTKFLAHVLTLHEASGCTYKCGLSRFVARTLKEGMYSSSDGLLLKAVRESYIEWRGNFNKTLTKL